MILGQLDHSAITRWPRLARFHRGSFHLANRNHLPRVRFGQPATAGEAAALADLGEIFELSLGRQSFA